MSTSYTHHGVTITPQPGGFYDLTHDVLKISERVRGKDKAEYRAEEIAASLRSPADEDTLIQQPDLASAAAAPAAPAPEPAAALDPKDAEIANLKAQLAAAQEAPAVATVQVTEGAVPSRVPADVPRQYTGTLSDEAKAALKIKFTRIVLEEVDDIPPTGLFIQHNFRPYLIRPSTEVDVPDFLLKVLDQAVMSAPVVDPTTRKVLGYRARSRYPYRIVR